MIIGTAGFTTMLCMMAPEDAGIYPRDEEIVVTGASGGIGSAAVALLYKLGYQVIAVSGRESTHEHLKSLSASCILPHDESAEPRLPERQVRAGAIDTVGDRVLAKVLAQMNYGDCVAACGLAGGFTLSTTIILFILCNARLQGVNSIITPPARCAQAWQRLVTNSPESLYTQAAKEIPLAETPRFAEAIVSNQVQGHTLMKVN